MGLTDDELKTVPWTYGPLCRRHILGVYNTSAVECDEAAPGPKLEVIWALGWISDGECESLGAWIEPPEGSEDYPWTVQSLSCRGLERIRTVTGSDVGHLHHCIARALSRSPARSFHEAAAMDGYPIFTRRMSAFRMQESEAFRGRLSRSLRRHGRFPTKDDALAYVVAALKRLERQLEKHHIQELDEAEKALIRRKAPPQPDQQ
jgi:hypothetical protein